MDYVILFILIGLIGLGLVGLGRLDKMYKIFSSGAQALFEKEKASNEELARRAQKNIRYLQEEIKCKGTIINDCNARIKKLNDANNELSNINKKLMSDIDKHNAVADIKDITKEEKLNKIFLRLAIDAEKKFGKGNGKAKKQEVKERLDGIQDFIRIADPTLLEVNHAKFIRQLDSGIDATVAKNKEKIERNG